MRANDRFGWIHFDAGSLWLSWTRYSLRADLPRQRLEMRYGRRLLGRFPITIGAAGTSTPPGASGSPTVSAAGMARRGPHRHPRDRRPGGRRASSVCLRARNASMKRLMAHVGLGAPVFID